MLSTDQYFNLPLACCFTMSELHEIRDALFTAYHVSESDRHYYNAKYQRELFKKIGKMIDNLNSI